MAMGHGADRLLPRVPPQSRSCAPQAWAAGAVFLLLQSCLGLSLSAEKKQIRLDGPHLPEAIPELWIRDLRVAGPYRPFP